MYVRQTIYEQRWATLRKAKRRMWLRENADNLAFICLALIAPVIFITLGAI